MKDDFFRSFSSLVSLSLDLLFRSQTLETLFQSGPEWGGGQSDENRHEGEEAGFAYRKKAIIRFGNDDPFSDILDALHHHDSSDYFTGIS